jgi:hypothetical protein
MKNIIELKMESIDSKNFKFELKIGSTITKKAAQPIAALAATNEAFHKIYEMSMKLYLKQQHKLWCKEFSKMPFDKFVLMVLK